MANAPSPLYPTEVIEEIFSYLRIGASLSVAVHAAKLPYPEFLIHLREGKQFLGTNSSRLSQGKKQQVALYQAYLEACADVELQQINRIETAAHQDWKAALWILEHRFPHKYGDLRDKDVLGLNTEEFARFILGQDSQQDGDI